ncbi:CRISPR-associated helicase Cas3' [Streptomyces sp. NPDC056983]|uniref:CRISPR-associated helicase Cas3' n=1 Tax=Streptomyces sp. NPDC056983 TaxID=3345987 RepID=UPI003636C620
MDPLLWGKEQGLVRPYPLICHLLDTAAMAGALWDRLLSGAAAERLSAASGMQPNQLRQVVPFWAGLHDLGKISPGFQRKCVELYTRLLAADSSYSPTPEAVRDDIQHDEATHWALVGIFEEFGYPAPPRRAHRGVGHQVAQLLGGHHGWFWKALAPRQVQQPRLTHPGLGSGQWEAQCRAHAAAVRRVTGAETPAAAPLPTAVAVVVAGIVVIADWLASQESFIAERVPADGWGADDQALRAHWIRSTHDAPAVVREAGLGRADVRQASFEEMFGFSPNPLQQSLVDELPKLVQGPGLLLVTAPPGDGKTEAALFAASVLMRASGAVGIGFSLPTMATADAMYDRIRAFAERALEADAALTRVHSMAWLSSRSARDAAGDAAVADSVVSSTGASVEAAQWLYARRRGMLAPLSVFTIDQALTGVLPVRYNVLRLLALSGKVLVVDEAHSYGPWMHALLVRLLEWLGAMGAPVVVLSATLTGRTADALVEAYLRGGGNYEPLSAEQTQPHYPGWIYVDGASGEVSAPHAVASLRERRLGFELHSVCRDVPVGDKRNRLAVVKDLLSPLVDGCRGTALVCCTTVAEAQETATFIQAWLNGRERSGMDTPDLHLLHSRYRPGDRRAITEVCETAFGKRGPRPKAAILVATQIVEQSLDLDFDLLVTDLAPMALLIQRSGRCQRHKSPQGDPHQAQRPAWATGDPRIVVLDPVNSAGAFEVPPKWGDVYDKALLWRTQDQLAERHGRPVNVPGDVQQLVDAVYAEEFARALSEDDQAQVRAADASREAKEAAELQLADIVRVPAPRDVGTNLHLLSATAVPVSENLIATRLGADAERVVCVYEQQPGVWTLDEDGHEPAPGLAGESRIDRNQARLVADHMIPVPGRWLRAPAGLLEAPDAWHKNAVLRAWRLLPLRREPDGRWAGMLQPGKVRYDRFGLFCD